MTDVNSRILHVHSMVIEIRVIHLKMPFIHAEITTFKQSGKAVIFFLSLSIFDDIWNLGHLNAERLETWNSISAGLWSKTRYML